MRIRFGRYMYLALSIGFILCILIQIYFAGMAIFMNPAAWGKHTMFVHLFGYSLPIFMVLFAILGSFPRWAYWQLIGFFILIFLMYYTANIQWIFPWISPMHLVLAFVLLVLSSWTAWKTWKLIFQQGTNQKEEI